MSLQEPRIPEKIPCFITWDFKCSRTYPPPPQKRKRMKLYSEIVKHDKNVEMDKWMWGNYMTMMLIKLPISVDLFLARSFSPLPSSHLFFSLSAPFNFWLISNHIDPSLINGDVQSIRNLINKNKRDSDDVWVTIPAVWHAKSSPMMINFLLRLRFSLRFYTWHSFQFVGPHRPVRNEAHSNDCKLILRKPFDLEKRIFRNFVHSGKENDCKLILWKTFWLKKRFLFGAENKIMWTANWSDLGFHWRNMMAILSSCLPYCFIYNFKKI